MLKWKIINMDFITSLPRTHRQYDSIWMIVDRVTKYARFLDVNSTISTEDYAKSKNPNEGCKKFTWFPDMNKKRF